MAKIAYTSIPNCPGCGTPMQNAMSRDRKGLFTTGWGCFGCEMWDIPFKNGRVDIDESKPREVIYGELGEPIHAHDGMQPGDDEV